MVFVNGQKFACESCIKGHRSSSCHHTERPLFEVKKKGRPVSQCEKCRELRKSKRVHSKCDCSSMKDATEPAMRQLSVKSKRFIPILPALPNGIKDALSQPEASATISHVNCGGNVTALLNPCHCKDIWNCKCRKRPGTDTEPSLLSKTGTRSGLAALADAAALCCRETDTSTAVVEIPDSSTSSDDAVSAASSTPKHPLDCCQSSSKRGMKKSRRQSPKRTRGPDLPPIVSVPSAYDSPSVPPPIFPSIPPLSSVASLAGSGCCCGYRCTCPGCVEHRGMQHAVKDHKDCPDGCGTCVDYDGGIELPILGGSSAPAKGTSFIDAFFARAAATIPLPPSHRALGVNLDPTNVTVYPTHLFSGHNSELDERSAAFGLVRLPKLECCAGRCGCPDGSCECCQSCDGCGEKHGDSDQNCCSAESSQCASRDSKRPTASLSSADTPATRVSGSCCG